MTASLEEYEGYQAEEERDQETLHAAVLGEGKKVF